ncbi:retrovirus-related pol polyprotein from transposon TNT 1-94, partial [Tanacetum coccineum]
DKGRGRKQDRGQKQNKGISKSKKRASKDKEVNMAVRDYDDTLVCCVENTLEDHIMDSGASFHATFRKEELEKFRLRSGKVRLANDKTLDIAGVRDVVLKTSFGASWTLKDVSLAVARGNKRGSLYMVEVPSDGINAAIDGMGNAALWHQRLGHMSEKGMKILASKGRIPDLQKAVVGFCKPCVLGKQKTADPATMLPLSMTTAGRMNRTLNERAKSMRLHAGLPKMFWEDSVNTAAYLINRGPSVPLGFRIPKEEWQGKKVSLAHLRVFGCDSYVNVKDVARDKLDVKYVKCTFIGYGSDEMGYCFWDSKSHKVIQSRDVTFNEDSLYGAKAATDFSNLTMPNQKDQVALEDSPDNLANKSIVTEHGLSSEITQSPCGSSDAKHPLRREAPRLHSYEDPPESPELRIKEFVQRKKAINEEMVSLEKNQTWSLVRLPAGNKALQSKWVFMVKEEQDGKKRLVLSIIAAKNLYLEQLDVKTAFLHGDLDEDIYMKQPEGFFSQLRKEKTSCFDMAEIKKLKRQLSQEFEMKDLGPAKQILGMSIIRDRMKEARCQPLGDYFKLNKKQAPKTEASRRRMAKVSYASVIGIVVYTMVCTRPDIAHVVGVVSIFMSNPGREH